MRVRDVMTTNVVSISLDERLDLADEIMSTAEIRHLPVTKGGTVVGVVSQRDLFKVRLSSILDYSEEERHHFLESVDISKIMTKDVQSAEPNESLLHAAKRMADLKIGCLPVVEGEGGLVGLITETDVIRHLVDILEEKE